VPRTHLFLRNLLPYPLYLFLLMLINNFPTLTQKTEGRIAFQIWVVHDLKPFYYTIERFILTLYWHETMIFKMKHGTITFLLSVPLRKTLIQVGLIRWGKERTKGRDKVKTPRHDAGMKALADWKPEASASPIQQSKGNTVHQRTDCGFKQFWRHATVSKRTQWGPTWCWSECENHEDRGRSSW
jgi:hypothetical protein